LPGRTLHQRLHSPRRLARATAVLRRKALGGRNGLCHARGSRLSATASYPHAPGAGPDTYPRPCPEADRRPRPLCLPLNWRAATRQRDVLAHPRQLLPFDAPKWATGQYPWLTLLCSQQKRRRLVGPLIIKT